MRTSAFSLLIAIVLLAGWELACRGFNIPDFILPSPSRIFRVAVLQAAILLPNAGTTAIEVLCGIFISLMVAVPLSIAMFAHPAVEKALAPFLVASQAVPVFAIAPLLVVWLGYGIASKVIRIRKGTVLGHKDLSADRSAPDSSDRRRLPRFQDR